MRDFFAVDIQNTSLKSEFLLDPRVIYLNHGSFGATPRPVFETYQAWQCELERQPTEFLGRRAEALLSEARTQLAKYLSVQADEVVYFSNPTTAINMVARNLIKPHRRPNVAGLIQLLHPGDEILATNHEYGALDRTWNHVCQLSGARYVRNPIPLPVTDRQSLVDSFWDRVNERTRVIFISHITSPTALTFPVEEICLRARQAGILSIVDGAHAPGQIDLDLRALGADIYAGACHKWLCAPKGSAFLFVRRELQNWLDPLVVSWGYESEKPSGSQFIDYHEWQGTRDLAAFLSVPAAIQFQAHYNWCAVRQACHELAIQARQRINSHTSLEAICPEDWFHQMFTIQLPKHTDLDSLKKRLHDEFLIEVPTIHWNAYKMIRVSIQAYNDPSDVESLINALEMLLQ